MNSQHRTIRAILREMAPKRAIEYIKAFELPELEETLIINLDVYDCTYAQLVKQGYSPEVIKRRRRRAYAKMADYINHV